MFGDTMRAIKREAKDIDDALGEQMEESGRKAGKRAGKALGEELTKEAGEEGKKYAGEFDRTLRAGIKKTQRELAPIKVPIDVDNLQSDLDAIKKQLKSLGDAKIDVDLDAKEAYGELKLLEKRLEALQRDAIHANVRVNIDEARKGLEGFVKRVESAYPELKVDVKIDEKSMGAFETKLRASAARAGKALSKELGGRAAEIRKELEALGDAEISPNISPWQARSQIAALSAELRAMAADSIDFEVKADTGSAYAELLAVNIMANKIDGKYYEATLDLNAKTARSEMGAFERQIRDTAKRASKDIGEDLGGSIMRIRDDLSNLADTDITPEIDGDKAMADMRALAAKLKAQALNTKLETEVRVDSAAAYAKLVPLMKMFSAIDGKKLDVEADLDVGAAVAKAGLLSAVMAKLQGTNQATAASGDLAANSFRSFNFVILAALTLVPALIPVVAALGGGLLALIPILGAVGFGLGTLLVGFSGIGDAVKAMGDVQENAAKDTQNAADKMRNAARQVEDAERALARARQSAAWANQDAARNTARAQEAAARAVEDALKRQRDAERSLAQAQRDARDAQKALTEARREARKELEQLADDTAQNALDERQAVIDLFNAQVEWNATRADGGSTNLELEQTDINLEQARLTLKNIRDEEKELAKDRKDGSTAVQSAEDALVAALERQRDAQRAVGEAAQDVRRARVEGARDVADAVRQQHRTEIQGQQSVADAARNLRRAQLDYQAALYETAVIGSESMQKLDEAMSKLGPAGQRFARFLYGLRDEAFAFRDAVQEALLPGVQAGLQAIIDTYGPQFTAFSARMAGVMGSLFERAGKGLGREPWREFFATYAKLAPRLLEDFGKTTGNWMGVYARLFTIVAPYAERLSAAMRELSENALGFMESAEGTKYWTDFMDYAERVGPMVWDFFKALFRFVVAIGKALAPLGELVLKVATAFMEWVASWPPKLLGFLTTALIGLVVAFQLFVGFIALKAMGSLIVAAGTFGMVAFAILTVIAVLVAAYTQFESVRDIVDAVGKFIWKIRKPLLAIAAAVAAVYLAMKIYALAMKVWTGITWAFFLAQYALATPWIAIAAGVALFIGILILAYKKIDWFRAMVDWVVDKVIAAFEWLWDVLFGNSIIPDIIDAFQAAWGVLKEILMGTWAIVEFVGKVFMWLWRNAVKPVLKLIIGFWRFAFKAMKFAWQNILRPVLSLIFGIIKMLWKKIVWPYLKLVLAFWKTVFKAMAWTWKNVLRPVLDLIFTIIKKLWNAIFKPILGFIGRRWEVLMGRMKWVWDKVLKPVFRFIIDKILPELKGAFDWVVKKIKSAWDKLAGIAKKPVKFVVNTVLNNGLIKGFNKIAGFVGSEKIKEIQLPEGFARGGIPSARNTDVYPGYSPGRDTGFIGIGGGEAIMRPEWTKMMGADYIKAANAAARRGMGALQQFMGGYARGGIAGVWHPGPRSSRPGHGKSLDQAWDINSPGGAGTPVRAFLEGVITTVANLGNSSYGRYIKMNHPGYGLQSLYAHLSSQLVRPGQKVDKGEMIGREGNTGGSTGAHLHFELGGGLSAIDLRDILGPGGVSGGSGLPGWLEKIIGTPMKWFKSRIADGMDALKDKFGGGELVGALTAIPKMLIEGLVDKVMSFFGGGDGAESDSATVATSKKFVREVAASYGWADGPQWRALVELVQRESSWDSTAANPDSSARGLFQKMTSIYGPVEDTVQGQARWGLRYIFDRYGTPAAALRFHDSKGWYSQGGVVPEGSSGGGVPDNGTMMYDRGGYLPPGLTTVLNLTGKPEPVLLPGELEGMRRGGDGAGIHYEPHFTESDLTAEDVSGDLLFTLKTLDHGGKYGRGGS